jgi:hypothetical protein
MVAVTNDPVRVATLLLVEGDWASMQKDGGVMQHVVRLGQHVQTINGEAVRLAAHKEDLPILAHKLWRQVDERRCDRSVGDVGQQTGDVIPPAKLVELLHRYFLARASA